MFHIVLFGEIEVEAIQPVLVLVDNVLAVVLGDAHIKRVFVNVLVIRSMVSELRIVGLADVLDDDAQALRLVLDADVESTRPACLQPHFQFVIDQFLYAVLYADECGLVRIRTNNIPLEKRQLRLDIAFR